MWLVQEQVIVPGVVPGSAPAPDGTAGTPTTEERLAALEAKFNEERFARERAEQAANTAQSQLARLTPIAVDQWLAQQPKEQQPALRAQLAQRLQEQQYRQREAGLEEAAKRTIIREAALDAGVPREELEDIAIHINDPEAIVRLAKRLAKDRAAGRATPVAGEPAIANVAPDGGGSGTPVSEQSIRAKYRGTGRLQDMYAELRTHGYRQ